MRWITFALTIATVAGLIAYKPPACGQGDGDAPPIYGIKIPTGYRDWPMISAALVGGPVNDLRVKLGNDLATKAYPEEKRPFPDGTIIARLACSYVASEENNKVFGRRQSFVAGSPTNGVQFMVKDTKKYATTGGWGFGEFVAGKPVSEAKHRACFACHEAHVKDHDFVFTRLAP